MSIISCNCMCCRRHAANSRIYFALTNSTEISTFQKLREENEALKTALEVYAMTKETFPEYGNVAKEVLAKYPRGEK